MWTSFKFWPIKNIFRKLWANESLIMACLQIYQELLSLAIFLQVYIQTKIRYPTSLDKIRILTFFLWTKLLEYLLLEKYLISVAAPLRETISKYQTSCIYIYDVKYFAQLRIRKQSRFWKKQSFLTITTFLYWPL